MEQRHRQTLERLRGEMEEAAAGERAALTAEKEAALQRLRRRLEGERREVRRGVGTGPATSLGCGEAGG